LPVALLSQPAAFAGEGGDIERKFSTTRRDKIDKNLILSYLIEERDRLVEKTHASRLRRYNWKRHLLGTSEEAEAPW
jgi:hypothetical protein